MAIKRGLILLFCLCGSAAVTRGTAQAADGWSGHEPVLAPRSALNARLRLLNLSQESSQDKPAKPQPKPVAGCVKDRQGAPAKRAPVVITRADSTPIEVYTNDTGCFSFAGIDGAYKITIKVDDKSETFDAMIANGRLNPNEFTMK